MIHLFIVLLFFETYDCLICSFTSDISELDDGCTTIDGIVILDQTSNDTTYQLFKKKLTKVEHIIGSVVVTNSTFKHLDFLPELRTIVYTPTYFHYIYVRQFALYIVNNPELETFRIPKIEMVYDNVMPTDVSFIGTRIQENPVICFHYETLIRIYTFPRLQIQPRTLCNKKIIDETFVYTKYTDQNETKIFCDMKYFNYSAPLGCHIFEYGIIVNELYDVYSVFSKENGIFQGDVGLNTFQKAIESVEIILGPIYIQNSKAVVLNFSNLRMINNMFFDLEQYMRLMHAVYFFNNSNLVTVSFPRQPKIYHYGITQFIYTDLNENVILDDNLCSYVRRFYMFEFNDVFSKCGTIPIFTPISTAYITYIESVFCIILTFSLYISLFWTILKTEHIVSYFQYSIIVYIVICSLEAFYAVLNYIEVFDDNNYGHLLGIQFLLFSNKRSYFYQIFNMFYTNRLALLCSCCLYRTVAFISLNNGKLAMFFAFLIFVISNVSSFGDLSGAVCHLFDEISRQYSYVLYPFTWFTFGLAYLTSIILSLYLAMTFKNYKAIRAHQLKLSTIFCSQATLAFCICGFPDAFFETYLYTLGRTQLRTRESDGLWKIVRSHTVFSYNYASIIVRWHYPIYAFMLRLSIRSMLKKVSTKIETVKRIKNNGFL